MLVSASSRLILQPQLASIHVPRKALLQRFCCLVNHSWLLSSSGHTAGSSHKRPSRVFQTALGVLIFHTPPEQPTELSTPNAFFSSKFQSTSTILPKTRSGLSKASQGSWNPQEGLWSQSYFANIQQCFFVLSAPFPSAHRNSLAVVGYTASQQSHAGQTWAQLAFHQWPPPLHSACYYFGKYDFIFINMLLLLVYMILLFLN